MLYEVISKFQNVYFALFCSLRSQSMRAKELRRIEQQENMSAKQLNEGIAMTFLATFSMEQCV